MATYAELREQSQKLAAEVEAAREAEIEAIVSDLRNKMMEYEITLSELTRRLSGTEWVPGPTPKVVLSLPKPRQSNPQRPNGSDRRFPKGTKFYRGPNGEVWRNVGNGIQPEWLREAIASGTSPDTMLITEEEALRLGAS